MPACLSFCLSGCLPACLWQDEDKRKFYVEMMDAARLEAERDLKKKKKEQVCARQQLVCVRERPLRWSTCRRAHVYTLRRTHGRSLARTHARTQPRTCTNTRVRTHTCMRMHTNNIHHIGTPKSASEQAMRVHDTLRTVFCVDVLVPTLRVCAQVAHNTQHTHHTSHNTAHTNQDTTRTLTRSRPRARMPCSARKNQGQQENKHERRQRSEVRLPGRRAPCQA